MKSLVCESPGHMAYHNAAPPQSGKGQALLKIRRIGICGTDIHAFEGTQPFFSYPRILGHEISAELIDSGGIPGWVSGEQVTVIPYLSCGICVACRQGKPNCCKKLNVLGVHLNGGMAEYLSVPCELLIKGEGLGYDALALIEPLSIGAHGIRRAEIQKGEFVLIMGAGPIGLAAMAFAKLQGGIVISMDLNSSRLQFCKSTLDIPFCIQPQKEDSTQIISQITSGEMANVVIDATGNLGAINIGLQYLGHGGRYVLIGLQRDAFSFSHPEFHKREATLMSSRNATREDFNYVIQTIRNGELKAEDFISERVSFEKAAGKFPGWLDPEKETIKSLVEF